MDGSDTCEYCGKPKKELEPRCQDCEAIYKQFGRAQMNEKEEEKASKNITNAVANIEKVPGRHEREIKSFCSITHLDGRTMCKKKIVGRCTHDWRKSLCEKHFILARSNGFMPARFRDDGTLMTPQIPIAMKGS